MTVYSPEEMREGMMRLGLVPEAKYLRQRLFEVLLSVPPRNADVGTLKEDAGRRTFADELMRELEFSPERTADGRAGADDIAGANRGGSAVRIRSRSIRAVGPTDPRGRAVG